MQTGEGAWDEGDKRIRMVLGGNKEKNMGIMRREKGAEGIMRLNRKEEDGSGW